MKLNLHPNYITGFIDGEGSFNITISLHYLLSTPLSRATRCPVIKLNFYQVRSSHNQSSNSNDIVRYTVRLTKAQKAILNEELMLNTNIQEVFTGLILGDSNLRMNGYQAHLQTSSNNYFLMLHLYELFNPLGIVGVKPKEYSYLDKRTDKIYTSYYLATYTLEFFTNLFNKWYIKKDGKNIKILIPNLDELLTPIALAYWIAGDGSYNIRTGQHTLCTDCFSYEEVLRLRTILYYKFNLISTDSPVKTGLYRILLSRKESLKLQDLVKDHIPPMMAYRIGLNLPKED